MKLLLVGLLFFSNGIFADAPVHACRARTETLKTFATTENNAGCVLSRVRDRELEFLLVYVDKNGGKDKGWTIPGGKPATRKNDATERRKTLNELAARTTYDYSEPVVCTAARETFEETGVEVVVEELLTREEKFLAFQCAPVDPKSLEGIPEAIDTDEIKKIAWVGIEQVRRNNIPLRFKSDLTVLQAAEKRQKKTCPN